VQIVYPEQYGAKGDGVADDTAAMVALGNDARRVGYLNAIFEPGKTYTHKNPNFLAGIPYVRISAYGAKIKNILGSDVVGWAEDRVALTFPLFWSNYGAGLINTTSKDWGDLIQSADAGANVINVVSGNARVSPGNRVLIYGFEGLGAPSNPPCGRVFEYAVVAEVSAGQIMLMTPLKNSYDSAWPDSINVTPSNPQFGAPRVVNLDRTGEFVQIKYLEIKGLETIRNEAWTDGFGTIERNGRVSIASCDRAILKDVKVAGGMYVNAGGHYEFDNVSTHPDATIEIDKMVDKVCFKGVKTNLVSGATAANIVELEDCSLHTGAAIGPSERLVLKGGYIGKGGSGSSTAMLQITHGVNRVELDGVALNVDQSPRTSIFSVIERTLPVVSVVSQTATDAVLDIGTQTEYESALFMRTVGMGYTLFDVADAKVAIVKRLPYLSAGRMLIGVAPLRTITTSDVLRAPAIQDLRVAGLHVKGAYGHQLVNVFAPFGNPATEGVASRLEF
jgi:hypothetical protein